MDGPMSGSGVMVLLHDPMVLPQMRDLAYAISPGSHTLLPVSHTEVRMNRNSNSNIKLNPGNQVPNIYNSFLFYLEWKQQSNFLILFVSLNLWWSIIVIWGLGSNLIAVKKLRLSGVQNYSHTLVRFEIIPYLDLLISFILVFSLGNFTDR